MRAIGLLMVCAMAACHSPPTSLTVMVASPPSFNQKLTAALVTSSLGELPLYRRRWRIIAVEAGCCSALVARMQVISGLGRFEGNIFRMLKKR